MIKPFTFVRFIHHFSAALIVALLVMVIPAFAVDGLGPGSPMPPGPVLNAGPTQITWTEDLGLSNYFVRFYRISDLPYDYIAADPDNIASNAGTVTWTLTGVQGDAIAAFLAVEGAYVWDVSESPPIYFQVDLQTPSPFSLVSPGAIFRPNSQIDTYPTLSELPTTFSWQQSAGAEYYKFRVGKLNAGGDNTFDVPAIQTTVNGGVVTWTPGEAAVKNMLPDNAQYVWQAQAMDDNGTPGDTGDDKMQGAPSFVFQLDVVFNSPFTLTSPASGALARGNTSFMWTPAAGAENYQFVLFHYSNDTRLGEVLNIDLTPEVSGCAAVSATTCSFVVPTMLFANGKFLWNVIANNGYSEADPTNGALTFTYNNVAFKLLQNSGFEIEGSTAEQASGWEMVNPTGERRLCTAKVPVGGSGCAFQFTGGSTPINISQTVKPALVKRLNIANDLLVLNFKSATKVTPDVGSTVRVILQFKGGVPNQVVNVPIAAETVNGDFTDVSQPIVVSSGTVKKIIVQVRNANASGKFFVDDLSLRLQPKPFIIE